MINLNNLQLTEKQILDLKTASFDQLMEARKEIFSWGLWKHGNKDGYRLQSDLTMLLAIEYFIQNYIFTF